MNTQKKLYLLDGMALAYRGHFALMRNPRMTSSGMNTSAVFAFANTIMSIIDRESPSHLAVVFDTPEPTHRHRAYPEYKAQREAMPEDLSKALPYILRFCEGLNIPVLKMPGWEADDVIGTLSRLAESEDLQTYMVTPDKDYGQLVSINTFIYKPGRSGDESEILGVEEIKNKWNIKRIDQVIDVLGLMGDASDNIPGVPGIGEKTAQKLIAQFGDIESLIAGTAQLKGKQRENIEKFADQAILSKELVTIDRYVPVKLDLKSMELSEYNSRELTKLFVELEFKTLGQRLLGDEFSKTFEISGQETDLKPITTISDIQYEYVLVETEEHRAELIGKLINENEFSFDLETTGLDTKQCGIIGIAFSWNKGYGFFVKLPSERDKAIGILHEFESVFTSGKLKVGHNLKFDLNVLRWHGISVEGPFFDTMLAAALLDPDGRRSMDHLANSLLSYQPVGITELIGERGDGQLSMDLVPIEDLTRYAVEDADVTWQLYQVLRDLIEESNLGRVLYEIECPLLCVLVDMEYEGISMESSVLKSMSQEFSSEIEDLTRRIFKIAEEEFNLNSGRQLGQILFEKLALDPNAQRTKKTGQYQTGESVLRKLANKHEIAQLVLNYRLYNKLKSTYVDSLPNSVFSTTGRVHTNFEQAVTATGRMQSHGPNLQNIPIRSEQGREIRKAFVPRSEEYVLLAADYSQIELRIAAELSQDQDMLDTFISGGDIHSTTAQKIYQVNETEVTDEMRRQAKTVNFGIIYGISAFGLAERLDVNRFEAREIIAQYFSQYSGIEAYMEETIEFARSKGYVETVTGRRRPLRDINSRNATSRKAAERNAINSRIQGSAADMIKLAMTAIHSKLISMRSKMLLQVHDELVFDLHKDEIEVVTDLVEREMCEALPMKVPITVETGTGSNWLEAH